MPKTELACGTCHDLYDFGGSRKGIENGWQKASKSDLKIDLLALWGSIFEILGGFWRGLIFYGFSSGKISAKSRKNWCRKTARDADGHQISDFSDFGRIFFGGGGGGEQVPDFRPDPDRVI